MLGSSGDDHRINWGYAYLAAPAAQAQAAIGNSADLFNAFLAKGELPAQDDTAMPDNAIQRMRQGAQEKGALQSTPQQTVATTTSNGQSYITIQPASPEVVYVPQYNPEAVWGAAA